MSATTAPPIPSLIAPPHVAARREREIHPVVRRVLLAALAGFAARRPLSIRIDSADAGTTPIDVTVKPGHLRVVAPGPGG